MRAIEDTTPCFICNHHVIIPLSSCKHRQILQILYQGKEKEKLFNKQEEETNKIMKMQFIGNKKVLHSFNQGTQLEVLMKEDLNGVTDQKNPQLQTCPLPSKEDKNESASISSAGIALKFHEIIFETGSYVTVFTPKRYVDEDDFEPPILSLLPPKHQDHTCVLFLRNNGITTPQKHGKGIIMKEKGLFCQVLKHIIPNLIRRQCHTRIYDSVQAETYARL